MAEKSYLRKFLDGLSSLDLMYIYCEYTGLDDRTLKDAIAEFDDKELVIDIIRGQGLDIMRLEVVNTRPISRENYAEAIAEITEEIRQQKESEV